MAAPREARVWRAHHHAGSSGHRATLGALGQLRAFAPVRVPVTCHCDWATGSLTPTQASLWENGWGAVELGVRVSGASPGLVSARGLEQEADRPLSLSCKPLWKCARAQLGTVSRWDPGTHLCPH